jgi:hypothetical protein
MSDHELQLTLAELQDAAKVIESDLAAERHGETQRGAEWQARARHAWLHRKREVRLCQAEIAGRKLERRSNKIATAVEAEMQRWQHYAAFVEVAVEMLAPETVAAIWRKMEDAKTAA